MAAKPQATETEPPIAPFARRFRLRTFRRLAGWGTAAVLAVGAVLIVSQTQVGGERLQLALAQTREPEPQAIAALPPRVIVDAEETRKLAETVRKLAADRDRLQQRLASLERNFDDMTGSIKTVMQANAAAHAAKAPPPAPPVIAPPPATTPPPAPTPVAKTPAERAPPQAAVEPPPIPEPVPLPPIPPMRVASVEQPPGEPAKIDYGIDLGSAASVEEIRSEWSRVKANFGPLIWGLRPLAAPRQRANGTDYRLLIGPFATAAAAARVCARFNSYHVACRTARFVGEEVAQR